MATFENTPEHLQEAVLRTCDKWESVDGEPCDRDAVRADQLDCWITRGPPVLEWTPKKLRPRARDLRVLLEVNVCMEKRRWRKLRKGPDF